MKTYLLTWNPNNWEWEDISKNQEELKKIGHFKGRWSCGVNKSINTGDRLFLMSLGKEPKGICASGYASSDYFIDQHWNGEPNKTANYVEFDFDIILNPNIEPILSIDKLKHLNQLWSPQSSGISINDEIVDELEKIWFEFNNKNHSYNNSFFDKPNINSEKRTYTEGQPAQTTLSRYERNPHARKECIKYYGYSCSVCKFNFYDTYGKIGENFIHVHHIELISSRKEKYELNPIKDLCPVCPNCHAMLHQSNPPLTIEELQNLIK